MTINRVVGRINPELMGLWMKPKLEALEGGGTQRVGY